MSGLQAKTNTDSAPNGNGAAVNRGASEVTIQPPNFNTVEVEIVGTAPLCISRFSSRIGDEMRKKQESGAQAQKGKKRGAKDFERLFKEAQYISSEGWCGVNASSFRNAMISACRLVGFKMTLAKLAVFVEADGYDQDDGLPLVKIDAPGPIMRIHATRNATGVMDLRPRPFWDEWKMTLRIRFDADLFQVQDILNLLSRVGVQCGIGEGRPNSKQSAGMGWGTFRLVERAVDGASALQ